MDDRGEPSQLSHATHAKFRKENRQTHLHHPSNLLTLQHILLPSLIFCQRLHERMELGDAVLREEAEERESEDGGFEARAGEVGAAQVRGRVSLAACQLERRENVRKVRVVSGKEGEVALESRDIVCSDREERANLEDFTCTALPVQLSVWSVEGCTRREISSTTERTGCRQRAGLVRFCVREEQAQLGQLNL